MNNFVQRFSLITNIPGQSNKPWQRFCRIGFKSNMPKILNIADELTQQFVRSKNKRHSAKHIIIELNSLHYPYSNQPIEYALKAAIVNLIQENLFGNTEQCIAFSKVKTYVLENLYRKNTKEKKQATFKNNLRIVLSKYKNFFLRKRPSF